MQKKIYLEILRIMCIFLVIFNHLPGYELYQQNTGYKCYIYMFITMITRINVPIFFMISGALLLTKTEDFSTVIKNRVKKFSLTLLTFSLLFTLLRCLIESNYSISAMDFTYRIFKGKISYLNSYWFLYAYLGFLFMLPFLQRIAKNFSKQDFFILIGLHFVFFSLIRIVNEFLYSKNMYGIAITDDFSVPLSTTKAFFYPLIGYYIEHNIDIKKIKKRTIAFLLLISTIGILISSYYTYNEGITTGTFTQNYVQMFDYVIAISTYIIIKYIIVVLLNESFTKKISTAICSIGSLTFGMYLLDPFWKLLFYKTYEGNAEVLLPTLLVSFGWCIISMTLSGILTYILKKIPLIKKIV